MINLGYKDFFGKEHKHNDVLKKDVLDGIVHIVMEERSISEKSFSQIDEVVDMIKLNLNPEIYNVAEHLLQSGKRKNYIMEYLYDTYKEELCRVAMVVESIKKFSDFK